MAEISKQDEARLRRHYVDRVTPADIPSAQQADEAVGRALRFANTQTGLRDVVVLAVSSLFAVLLVFFAPVARQRHPQRSGRRDDDNGAGG